MVNAHDAFDENPSKYLDVEPPEIDVEKGLVLTTRKEPGSPEFMRILRSIIAEYILADDSYIFPRFTFDEYVEYIVENLETNAFKYVTSMYTYRFMREPFAWSLPWPYGNQYNEEYEGYGFYDPSIQAWQRVLVELYGEQPFSIEDEDEGWHPRRKGKDVDSTGIDFWINRRNEWLSRQSSPTDA